MINENIAQLLIYDKHELFQLKLQDKNFFVDGDIIHFAIILKANKCFDVILKNRNRVKNFSFHSMTSFQLALDAQNIGAFELLLGSSDDSDEGKKIKLLLRNYKPYQICQLIHEAISSSERNLCLMYLLDVYEGNHNFFDQALDKNNLTAFIVLLESRNKTIPRQIEQTIKRLILQDSDQTEEVLLEILIRNIPINKEYLKKVARANNKIKLIQLIEHDSFEYVEGSHVAYKNQKIPSVVFNEYFNKFVPKQNKSTEKHGPDCNNPCQYHEIWTELHSNLNTLPLIVNISDHCKNIFKTEPCKWRKILLAAVYQNEYKFNDNQISVDMINDGPTDRCKKCSHKETYNNMIELLHDRGLDESVDAFLDRLTFNSIKCPFERKIEQLKNAFYDFEFDNDEDDEDDENNL